LINSSFYLQSWRAETAERSDGDVSFVTEAYEFLLLKIRVYLHLFKNVCSSANYVPNNLIGFL